MAYAAVISLKHTIERLINPTCNTEITKSVYEKLGLLKDVLKGLDGSSNSSTNRRVINALDAEIREAVCKLQDVFESYVLHQLNPSVPPNSHQGLDEKGVNQQIDSFLKTVKKFEEDYIKEIDKLLPGEEDQEEEDDDVSPLHDDGGKKPTTVGLSDQFEKIRNELLDWQSGPKTVSLLGMAGIGKTHLAEEIYQHHVEVKDFDFTAWVRVGPKHKMKNIVVSIIAQIEGKPRNVYMEKNMFTLAKLLQKCLQSRRRYLIVLDDIWCVRVCNTLIWWLPANGNGRRLLMTTRLEEVAKYHSTSIHQMRFLDNEESWNLLEQNVFLSKSLGRQLEKVGKKIAENCEGLPLFILAVADILCGFEKTEEYWRKVADKKTTTFEDAYDKISKVLFSSYEYLPQHLKAFFLYMGVFPQSCEIPISKIINFLAVEDFLESSQLQNIEYFAMEYLKELVSNSLAIVCKQSYNYRIKSCRLHSVYWHLCVKEARKNKFFHVLKKLIDCSKDFIESQRRLCVQNNVLFGMKEVHESVAATSTAHSLLCTGEDHQYPVPIFLNLMLLKVLDALPIRFYEFPTEVVKLLQLRYLALTHNGKLPSSISKLRNLQCLIVRQHHNIKILGDSSRPPKKVWDNIERSARLLRGSTSLPKEIWDMQELRHLRIMGSNLPEPSYCAELPKLSTLYVNAHSCTKDVFRSTPELKKLGIKIELQPDATEILSCFEHVWLLHKLESLKCVVVNPQLRSQAVAPADHLSNLPRGLKKLSLNGLGYSWNCIREISWLPKLGVLKLRCSAFQGPEWETRAEDFQCLEFLQLEDLDLVHWRVDDAMCFPHLQGLIIRHCYKLKEIPAIPTLKTIEVVDCSPSVVASARQIQENISDSLQLVIISSLDKKKMSWQRVVVQHSGRWEKLEYLDGKDELVLLPFNQLSHVGLIQEIHDILETSPANVVYTLNYLTRVGDGRKLKRFIKTNVDLIRLVQEQDEPTVYVTHKTIQKNPRGSEVPPFVEPDVSDHEIDELRLEKDEDR